jgi:hypothetical protein
MRKPVAILIIPLLLLLAPAGALFAQDYTSADVLSDMESVAQSFSTLFGENLGGISMIGDPVGYAVIPHFAVGITGGFVFVPIENINDDPDFQYDLGDIKYAFIPSVGVHMRLNISRFEVGAKLAGIPQIDLSKLTKGEVDGQLQNVVIGGKLRYGLIDKHRGVFQYGVSVGGFYEFTRGDVGLNLSDTVKVYEEVDPLSPGEEHVANLNTTSAFDSTWTGHTLGGEVQGNVKVLFVNLFAGGRVSTSFGKATTSINGDVTVQPVPAYAGFVSALPTESVDVTTEAKPGGIDFYGFGGLEFKILPVVLGVRGGYNFSNQVITLDLGARLQF